MIGRIETGQRMSKIVKHNGVAYFCGQIGDGQTVADQTKDCLSRVEALLEESKIIAQPYPPSDYLVV